MCKEGPGGGRGGGGGGGRRGTAEEGNEEDDMVSNKVECNLGVCGNSEKGELGITTSFINLTQTA